MALRERAVLPWLLALAALAGCGAIDPDELRCEEAMKRVLDCCPGVTQSPVACEHRQSNLSPYIWLFPRVDCLAGLSCAELQASGACAWAASPTTRICP